MTIKRAYCFTHNNYDESSYGVLARTCEDLASYAILGREIGQQGTPHIQGYIRFKKPYRFNTIKDRYLPGCHITVAAGTAQQNRAYCSKDGDYREFGELSEGSQGSKRDETAKHFVSCLESGRRGLVEFSEQCPGEWYYSGHNLLRNYLTVQGPIRRDDVLVRWFFGPPGSGKSRRAHDEFPDAYIKDPRTKWWNGYQLEKHVIIDDYGLQCADINHLLRWFDRYKCLVESKHGMLPLHASQFIVTSNFHPNQLFRVNNYVFRDHCSVSEEGEHPQLPALMRRIKLEEFFV